MDSRKLIIRQASPADAGMIADLSRTTFYETFAKDNSAENMEMFLREQFARASLIEEVLNSSNTFLLAFNEEQPAGYAKLRQPQTLRGFEDLSTVEIARIYVVKDFIGTGFGAALMEHIIEIARQWKAGAIWLAVWEQNQPAISFYQRWGFTIFDQQVFLLGRDMQKDWRMIKML